MKIYKFDKKNLEILDSEYTTLSNGIGGGGTQKIIFKPI